MNNKNNFYNLHLYLLLEVNFIQQIYIYNSNSDMGLSPVEFVNLISCYCDISGFILGHDFQFSIHFVTQNCQG